MFHLIFIYCFFNFMLAGFLAAATIIVYIFFAVWWALIDEGYYVLACIWPLNTAALIYMAYTNLTHTG